MNSTTTKKNPLSRIIVGTLAIMLGIMSVFAGSKVLLEIDIKDYNVLIWLITYNVIFGAISIVVGFFILKNLRRAKQLVLFVLTMHIIVLLYLKFFSVTVAPESIKAMVFRVGVWVFITLLYIVIPQFLNKKQYN